MAVATVHNETHIDADPTAVYEFVTVPADWVGTHPVTKQVKGDTERSAGVGASWIEVIAGPGQPAFEATWTVTAADPGARWVIETDRLRLDGVRCEITYTFRPEADGTRFDRQMRTDYPDDLPADFGAGLRDGSVHADYLANVKAALER